MVQLKRERTKEGSKGIAQQCSQYHSGFCSQHYPSVSIPAYSVLRIPASITPSILASTPSLPDSTVLSITVLA